MLDKMFMRTYDVIEMGGMFTIFKVRDDLTNYTDPGWYQHPPEMTAAAVDIEAGPHKIRSIQVTQKAAQSRGDVSWLSQEEEKRQPCEKVNMNWMQSNCENRASHPHS